MKRYKRVIIGASFLGVGLAVHNPNGTLVIEKNIFCGSEFCHSYNIKPCNIGEKYSEKTEGLKNQLLARNVFDENGVYSALLPSFYLANELKKSECDILFDTVVVDMKRQNEGYLLTIFNYNGFSDIYAEKNIDTTDNNDFIKKKFYCCAVKNNHYIKVSAENESLTSAREKIYKVVSSNKDEILSFSPTFCYDYENNPEISKNDGYINCPSASFENLLCAFEAGKSGEIL